MAAGYPTAATTVSDTPWVQSDFPGVHAINALTGAHQAVIHVPDPSEVAQGTNAENSGKSPGTSKETVSPTGFYEVRLTAGSRCLLWNSIVVLPNFLTPTECSLLMHEADQAIAHGETG